MEKTTIRFRVSGQNLTMVGNHHRFASNSVGLVRIEIDPEDEWIQFDSVDAVFQNDQDKTTMTMFYEGASYTCAVPADMLSRMAKVYVNLSGKNIVDGELVERLTTYPVLAFIIDETSNVSNYRDSVVPANQYEQFIEAVGRQASKLADVEVTAHQSEEPEVIKTYTPNYPLSLDFGLVKGDKGDQGIQGIQGETGDAAGFGTVSATVDANHGTPAVTVTASGDDTAKNFAFAFSNLQPAPYDDSVIQARMDTFTNLAAGSTTGDAELADGRVGADGVTYTNIGGAIRGQVTDLKSEITDILGDMSFVKESLNISNWKQGTIITSTGENSTSSTRCRTNAYLSFTGSSIKVSPKNGYKVGVRIYTGSSASSYVTYRDFTTDSFYILDLSKYYRFVVAKVDDSDVTPEDLPSDAVAYDVLNITDDTLTQSGKSADAKTTGDAIAKDRDAIAKNKRTIGIDSWKNGTINQTTGVITNGSSTRCYSNEKVLLNGLVKLNIEAGYKVSGREYRSSDDSFVGTLFGWEVNTVEFIAKDDCYYRFVIANIDDSAITDSSLSEEATATMWVFGDGSGIVSRNNQLLTTEKLQQLNRKTRIAGTTFGNKPLCLIHFSDIHGDKDCLQNVVDFKGAYSDYIDDIIHTGDTVYYDYDDGIDFWDSVDGAENILNVIGNHDTRDNVGGTNLWDAISMADSYDTYFAPYIANWGVQSVEDKTYYYKDYSTEKVRLIVLDIMHQTSEQLSWFEATLADAITNELHVLCAVHSRAHWLFDSYDTSWDDKIHSPEYNEGYEDTSAYTGINYPSNLSNDYANAVDDFITDGGEFICWIHGHTHFKMFAQLQTHPNQLDVSVSNASGTSYARTYVWERVIGTKSMDDFNVLAIDTTGKILRIMKVGVDYDRYMRHVDTISYNYGTRELIYSN